MLSPNSRKVLSKERKQQEPEVQLASIEIIPTTPHTALTPLADPKSPSNSQSNKCKEVVLDVKPEELVTVDYSSRLVLLSQDLKKAKNKPPKTNCQKVGIFFSRTVFQFHPITHEKGPKYLALRILVSLGQFTLSSYAGYTAAATAFAAGTGPLGIGITFLTNFLGIQTLQGQVIKFIGDNTKGKIIDEMSTITEDLLEVIVRVSRLEKENQPKIIKNLQNELLAVKKQISDLQNKALKPEESLQILQGHLDDLRNVVKALGTQIRFLSIFNTEENENLYGSMQSLIEELRSKGIISSTFNLPHRPRNLFDRNSSTHSEEDQRATVAVEDAAVTKKLL